MSHFLDTITPYLLPVITMFNGWLLYLVNAIRQDKKEIQAKVVEIDKRLSDFQLLASKEYVTIASMRLMESNVLTAINRIADRLDKVIENERIR